MAGSDLELKLCSYLINILDDFYLYSFQIVPEVSYKNAYIKQNKFNYAHTRTKNITHISYTA